MARLCISYKQVNRYVRTALWRRVAEKGLHGTYFGRIPQELHQDLEEPKPKHSRRQGQQRKRMQQLIPPMSPRKGMGALPFAGLGLPQRLTTLAQGMPKQRAQSLPTG